MSTLLIILISLFLASATAQAQQPFVTDDAGVTEHKKFQLQISHEFDVLPRNSYPSRYQNTTVFVLNYGLLPDVEVGVDYPLIVISNSSVVTPKTITGFGDLDFHVKYNFLKEREGSHRPALTVSFSVEVPTGDESKQLGSGLLDYSLNGVLQKSLTKKTTLRLNTGIVFAGNTSTGEVGIASRGQVFITGGSLQRQFTPKLNLGFELIGAVARHSGSRQLQTQIGGNYQLTEKMSFDFGLIAGRGDSPRAGAVLGISIDF
ncbi:MAG TPA: transporter [Pyrinomonadaceae bacterium]|nr:transporter [Pyrinomonadaceae bacterium]